MNKVLEYIIRAFDRTKEGTDSAGKNADSLALRIGKNLMNIKAGWDMASSFVSSAAKRMWSAISEAFRFETLTTQFSVLMGSMDKAKNRMRELADFAASTPFQLEEVVVASRQLHVFSDGALGAKSSLKLVGDAAAAVGQNIQELSFWVGRAYSMIKGGQPFGEAAMRLQEMGVITPEVRSKMEELQKAGASNAEVWAVLEERLATFKGGMETLSKTGDGLTSTLKDNWTAAVREFGQAFSDQAKGGIKDLSDRLQELNEDGTIAVWADKAVKAINMVKEAAGMAAQALGWLYRRSGASDAVAQVRGLSRGVGAVLGGGGFGDVGRQYQSGLATGFYGGKVQSALGDPFGGIAQNAQYAREEATNERRVRAKAAAKKAEKADAVDVAETEKQEKEKVQADLAKAQKGIDEKKAKELAEKEAAERIKIAEKEAEERRKLAAQQIEAEHRARIANIRSEADTSAKTQADAADRLSRARAGAQQAWGWYRDPESFKRQLAEEKDEAAAQKQFDKDFDKLNDRRDWRTTDRLSEREESVRRVALSREEEKRAEAALVAIEANTKDLAKKLDELLSMKGGS